MSMELGLWRQMLCTENTAWPEQVHEEGTWSMKVYVRVCYVFPVCSMEVQVRHKD